MTYAPIAVLAALALTGCASLVAPTAAPGDLGPPPLALPQAGDSTFQAAAARIAKAQEPARARNVILFVGDGMGVATVTAARIFAGQSLGLDGESFSLAMDEAPHTALSRTYSFDFQIADSAATATALVSGIKTRSGVLGLTSAAPTGLCGPSRGKEAPSLFALAEAQGLATGLVSTARITHATPAAAYAAAANRNWETDADVPKMETGAPCIDIARQLVEWPAGDGLEVALGGGRANFLTADQADPEHKDAKGRRTDGRDLTAAWTQKSAQHRYVWSAKDFTALDFATDIKVLGLFEPSHMAFEVDRAQDPAGEPSLAEMTRAAITRLSQDKDGYVLMVEAGRIDHAHHDGRAHRALADTVAMDAAIRAALEMTKAEDTLIVATADHSHVLSIAGYAARGTPILGLSGGPKGPTRALDGLPYTTLAYANGPGAVFPAAGTGAGPLARPDLTGVDTTGKDFRQQALVPLGSETHGGEDVAIYAWGPGAAQFAGTLEQNAIFHAMARALGWRFEGAGK